MPAKIVLGAQWGDEGKAKVVDYLTSAADVVVRYQGGANAGHTVVTGDAEFIFHAIPSGIMHEGKICVVGNGVVVDPAVMLDEIAELETKGFSVADRFFLSQVAHVVMPYHKVLEKAGEESENSVAIGTTGRGIGPTYRDKVERSHGVRVMDLCDPARLRDKLRASICAKNEILTKVFGQEPLEAGPIIDAYIGYGEQLAPYVADTSLLLNQALDQGKTVLCEGAQGTLLDIDHGTYPYVTSSNTTAGGACTGAWYRSHADRRGRRRDQSVHHAGRQRAFSHRVTRGRRRAPARLGPRVRSHYRPAAALRLVRRRHLAGLGPHQRSDQHRSDPARRTRPMRAPQTGRWLSLRRPSAGRIPRGPAGTRPMRADLPRNGWLVCSDYRRPLF